MQWRVGNMLHATMRGVRPGRYHGLAQFGLSKGAVDEVGHPRTVAQKTHRRPPLGSPLSTPTTAW